MRFWLKFVLFWVLFLSITLFALFNCNLIQQILANYPGLIRGSLVFVGFICLSISAILAWCFSFLTTMRAK